METNGPKKQAAVAVVTPIKGYEVVGFDVFPLNVSCCTRTWSFNAIPSPFLRNTESIPQSNTIGSFWDAKAPFKNTTCAGMQPELLTLVDRFNECIQIVSIPHATPAAARPRSLLAYRKWYACLSIALLLLSA